MNSTDDRRHYLGRGTPWEEPPKCPASKQVDKLRDYVEIKLDDVLGHLSYVEERQKSMQRDIANLTMAMNTVLLIVGSGSALLVVRSVWTWLFGVGW